MEKLAVMYDREYKKYLSKKDWERFVNYKSNHYFIDEIDDSLLGKISMAQLKWARELEATVFTQIFLPLTGFLSGKYMALYDIVDGKVVYRLDGDTLKKCECDASSFPNGGQRSTCCARGYTKWDIHQPVYVAENNGYKILYIPSIFTSYDGTALDNISVLFKCDGKLNEVVSETLSLLGEGRDTVHLCSGMEQEYFLFPTKYVRNRKDLLLCGRELVCDGLGMDQEQYAHYFALPRPKICDYMSTLRKRLVDMGINVQAQHSEVAPRQYEIVPKYTPITRSVFENAIIKQTIIDVASKFDLTPIFNEKVNSGVNGSGKHINMSLASDKKNYFDIKCGAKLFLLFVTSMVSAIARHKDLVLASVISYNNEMRLGGNEAPPMELSVYLGESVFKVFNEIANGKYNAYDIWEDDTKLRSVLSNIICNDFDRNRTSPFAFTGNKFEYRMVGSNNTGFVPLVVISTILCEKLADINKRLKDAKNIQSTYMDIIKDNILECQKIVFNGDNYKKVSSGDKKDVSALDVFEEYNDDKNISLFVNNSIFTEKELSVIYNVEKIKYKHSIMLDRDILCDLVHSKILPGIAKYLGQTKDNSLIDCDTISAMFNDIKKNVTSLEKIKIVNSANVSKIKKFMTSISDMYKKLCHMIPREYFDLVSDDALFYDCK